MGLTTRERGSLHRGGQPAICAQQTHSTSPVVAAAQAYPAHNHTLQQDLARGNGHPV